MYTLTQRLHNSNIDWHLTEEEKDELRLDWSKKSIRRFWDFELKFKEMHPEFY
jgi:tRNA (guanosine-2'-O-)-methyltransferase